MKIQLPKHKAAFSLIETIIAISVLAMVLLFSVTLGSVSLRNMVIKAETTQATSLARTNIEQVRNMRDNAWLNKDYTDCGDDRWDCWVASDHSSPVAIGQTYVTLEGNSYYLLAGDTTSPESLRKLDYGDNSQMEYRSTIKISEVSKYTGDFIIKMDQVGANDADAFPGGNTKIYLVQSNVTWNSYGRDYNVMLKTYLSDWLPRF